MFTILVNINFVLLTDKSQSVKIQTYNTQINIFH